MHQSLKNHQFIKLSEIYPNVSKDEILADFRPPKKFNSASLQNYIPHVDYPTQQAAQEQCRQFAQKNFSPSAVGKKRNIFQIFNLKVQVKPGRGIYLDGGFGVGKTHLLVSLFNMCCGVKYYGTFIEYTSLIGAMGYSEALFELSKAQFIAIDEFELDDPGDTMLISRFLGDLCAAGTHIAATSNTPPGALGEGRFASRDFLREINKLAGYFDTIRIDGTDYRQKDAKKQVRAFSASELHLEVSKLQPEYQPTVIAQDDFAALLAHLAKIHASKYSKMLKGIKVMILENVTCITDQASALRFVAFIDKVYDAEIRIIATINDSLHKTNQHNSINTANTADTADTADTATPRGEESARDRRIWREVFDSEMLKGPYQKKYMRCISRLIYCTN